MLDAPVITRIRECIAAELRPRDRTLSNALQTERRRHGANTGGAAHGAIELGNAELQIRARIIWAAIKRSYASLVGRDSPTVLEDLQQQIAEHLTDEARIVSQIASDDWRADSKVFGLIRDSINIERRNELREQLEVEVKFYVDELRRPVAAGAQTSVMNFNGPVGAVQTGSYSTANVSFSTPETQRFVEAIEALRRSVESNTEISSDQRTYSVEIASELIAATKAATPNPAKVRGLVGGLGQTVQTVASLAPAWQAVQDAAITIGAWLS